MPFLLPNQQRQSTEGISTEGRSMARFTSRHLQADCLYTGISSRPNARQRVWENFTLPYLIGWLRRHTPCFLVSSLQNTCSNHPKKFSNPTQPGVVCGTESQLQKNRVCKPIFTASHHLHFNDYSK